MALLKTLIDVFIRVVVLFIVVINGFHLVYWSLLSFEVPSSGFVIVSRVGGMRYFAIRRAAFFWDSSLAVSCRMACVSTFLTNQFGVIIRFVWVGWFLHWDGVFFFNSIGFVTLAGSTFGFSVAGLAAVEALSLESFSFGLCRRPCRFGCCARCRVGGGDRVK